MKSMQRLMVAATLALVGMPAQAATAEPIGPELTTNAAAVDTACDQLRYDQVLLAVSRATNDAAGVAANVALVRADRAAVAAADTILGTSIAAYLQAAEEALAAADAAYQAAFAQLRYDVARNPANVGADTTAVLAAYGTLKAALDQLEANRQALAGAGALGGCAGGGAGMGVGQPADVAPGLGAGARGAGRHPGGPMRRQ